MTVTVRCFLCDGLFTRKPSEIRTSTACCSRACQLKVRHGWTKNACGSGHDITNPENIRVRKTKSGESRECRTCMLETRKVLKSLPETKIKIKAENHKQKLRRYGIAQSDFDAMLAVQGGCCRLCSRPFQEVSGLRPHIDHDHETGKVRSLLHGKCNTAIGLLDEDSDRCRKAAEYLEFFKPKPAFYTAAV